MFNLLKMIFKIESLRIFSENLKANFDDEVYRETTRGVRRSVYKIFNTIVFIVKCTDFYYLNRLKKKSF